MSEWQKFPRRGINDETVWQIESWSADTFVSVHAECAFEADADRIVADHIEVKKLRAVLEEIAARTSVTHPALRVLALHALEGETAKAE